MLIEEALNLILIDQSDEDRRIYEEAPRRVLIPSESATMQHMGRKDALEACRGLQPQDLARLRHKAVARLREAREASAPDLVFWTARRDQVDRVCDIYSVFLRGHNRRACGPITNQGIVWAREIFGIQKHRPLSEPGLVAASSL